MMTSRRTFDDDILKSQPVSVVFLFSQLDCGIFFGIFVAATSDVFFFFGGGVELGNWGNVPQKILHSQLGVSKNNGTSKSSILIGFPL